MTTTTFNHMSKITTTPALEKAKIDRIKAFMSTPESQEVINEELDRIMLAVLAKRIKEVRKAKGLTQTRLAQLMGMKQPEIVRIEKGESNIQANTIFSFLRAVNGRFEIIY